MEDFAQTGASGDLFDDEIVPIRHEHQTAQPLEQRVEQISLTETQPELPIRRVPTEPRSQRGRDKGKGGRGQRGARGGALTDSRWADNIGQTKNKQSNGLSGHTTSAVVENAPAQATDQAANGIAVRTDSSANGAAQGATVSAGEPQQNQSSTEPTKPKPQAVRGPRQHTGGPPRTKLTEEELKIKMAAAKERSKKAAEAHARAQADQADFEERERMAAVKRAEEVKYTRQQGQEREANRLRKMKAQTGREWDAEKNQVDFEKPRYGTNRPRHQEGDDLKIYEWRDENEMERDREMESERGGRGGGRGRGRGGGRGDRGRGDGGRGRGQRSVVAQKQPVPKVEDFPALPGAMTPAASLEPKIGTSWADQMAA